MSWKLWLIQMLVVFALLMGLWEWTDRNIEYVCAEVSGHPVEIHGFWSLCAAGTGPIAFFFNVGTEIYAATIEQSSQD